MGVNREKRILVTGSNGFIGQRLVGTLRKKGFIVEEFDLHIGDISTYSFEYDHLDHVVHLASLVFVPASWENPVSFYQTNVMGTVNVLELCRKLNCPVTYLSSYVYGTPQYLPVDEKHPLLPASPYNHSKLLAEDTCRYYSTTFGFPATVFRPVNVFGPNQNPAFLVPKIIKQAFDSAIDTIEVIDLRPKRDFLFIDDLINAIIKSFDQKNFDIFNLGSGYSVSVEELIKTILNVAGIEKPYTAPNIERKNETWDVYNDISKIRKMMGWHPETSFDEGIKICIDEYKAGNK